mgnify:CR=1 FL=1
MRRPQHHSFVFLDLITKYSGATLMHNLICSFFSSGQRFARGSSVSTSGFLQIPPRDGHPCLRLCPSHCRTASGLSPVRNVRRQAHHHKKTPVLSYRGLIVIDKMLFSYKTDCSYFLSAACAACINVRGFFNFYRLVFVYTKFHPCFITKHTQFP